MVGADGHNMTNIEDGADATAGGDDAQNKAGQEVDQDGHEPGGAAPLDGGAEDQEAGGFDSAEEVPAGEEEPGAEPEPAPGLDPEAISEMVAKTVQEAMAKNAPPPPADLTEEQWAAKEQEVGVPRGAIKFFTNQAVQVYNKMMEVMETRLAGMEKESSLRTISREKGFTDALRYPKYVNEFLSKYNPKYHNNPELLRMAVVYARGKAANGNVQNARTAAERNRRIAGTARPGAPGNGARRPVPTGSGQRPKMNDSQRQVAGMFGMSEAEYMKLKNGGKTIAI